MSYQSSKYVRPEELFSGGYVDNTPNEYLGDKYSPFLRNARLEGHAIKIRPGHERFATLTSGDFPRGIGARDSDIILRHNISNTEKLAVIENDGTITNVTTGTNIVSDNRMNFTTTTDGTYCLNGTDPIGILTGTSYTVISPFNTTRIRLDTNINSGDDRILSGGITYRFIGSPVGNTVTVQEPRDNLLNVGDDVTGSPSSDANTVVNIISRQTINPAFSVIFSGSQWIGGGELGNKLIKSVAGDFSDFTGTGSDELTFQDDIVGLATNNQTLYIYTKDTISAIGENDVSVTAGVVTFNTRVVTVKEGATNHNSIVSVGYNVYHLTPSNKISIVARGQNLSGYEVLELTERKYKGITNILSTLDDNQEESWGEYYPRENLIKWFVRTAGATFNDLCIIYDITTDSFLIDEQKPFYAGVKTDLGNFTVSNIEPKVFRDEIEQDDDNDPIEFEYWTKGYDLGDPTRKKILWEMRTVTAINELAVLIQDIFIDGSLVDTRTIDRNDIINIQAGIGGNPVAELSIGAGTDQRVEPQEVNVLRTKGNLNVKGRRIQLRYRCNSLAAEALLRDGQFRVEILDPLADNI